MPWIFAASVLGEDTISVFYNDLTSWHLFTEYTLEHDVNIYDDNPLLPSVGFKHKDAQVMRRLAGKLGDKLLDITGIAFVPYANPPMADHIESSQKDCNCKSISEPQVLAGPGLSHIEDERVYMCADCTKVHGLEYKRRPIRMKKAFDADWVLDGETADEFIDAEVEEDYLLYSSGNQIRRLEHSIALMSMIGGSISSSFSRYNPDKQKALIYVKDDVLAGYLTWAPEADGRPALQQLFTREKYRGMGVASTLISRWAAQYCEHKIFYVEEPNEKSKALFKKLGYWSGEPQAVEHYVLRGLAKDWKEGMETAGSISNFKKQV